MNLRIVGGTLLILSTTVFAGRIEHDLQAVILSAAYAKAALIANQAVAKEGMGFVTTLGNTSRLDGDGPAYFYYIPVNAIRVPLSPLKPKLVGHIVGSMELEPNAPVPLVKGVSFKPAGDPPADK